MVAETASLTATLIDRTAARARVEHVLTHTPVAASIEAAPADAPLFCEKGRASVSSLAPVASASAPRARLWLRLSAAERRRVNLAAAVFGQSTAAFLRDALTAFIDNFLPIPSVRPADTHRVPKTSRERRVKLALRVDAGVHAAVHSAAAQRGESIQALLVTAIDVHLARLMAGPGAKNLRALLDAFDAVSAERAHGPGAEVIDFPLRPRAVASAPPLRRQASR